MCSNLQLLFEIYSTCNNGKLVTELEVAKLVLAVVFGGGAAHGAYQAGVWSVLGPRLAPAVPLTLLLRLTWRRNNWRIGGSL